MSATALQPELVPHVPEGIAARQDKAKRFFDRGTKELPALTVGQRVSIDPFRRHTPWILGTCIQQVGPRSYLIRTDAGGVYRRNRKFIHVINSQPLIGSRPTVTQTPGPTRPLCQPGQSASFSSTLSQPTHYARRKAPSLAHNLPSGKEGATMIGAPTNPPTMVTTPIPRPSAPNGVPPFSPPHGDDSSVAANVPRAFHFSPQDARIRLQTTPSTPTTLPISGPQLTLPIRTPTPPRTRIFTRSRREVVLPARLHDFILDRKP